MRWFAGRRERFSSLLSLAGIFPEKLREETENKKEVDQVGVS